MNYHLIGIGGIGMSGLALLLKEQGLSVSGSDIEAGEMTERLKSFGIPVFINHDSRNIPEKACIVYSSGIHPHNCELLEAKKDLLPLMHRSDLLHWLMKDQQPLLVTGSHGKTTTSALLAAVFFHGGMSPSYAIGGILKEFNTNAAKGHGSYFVAEADESDGSFLKYQPFGAIMTNIGNDHMDYYQSEETLIASFKQFGSKITSKDHFFFCNENEGIRKCNFSGISYGFNAEAVLRGLKFKQEGWRITFDVEFENTYYPAFEVPLVGYHNALNTLAVIGMALKCGISVLKIQEALKNFNGVKRRSELIGEYHKIQVRDDYGHHPNEIKATLKALKNAVPSRRLIVIFQPHRYSRTRECFNEFQLSFEDADEVLITDIYAAGETCAKDIHAESLTTNMKNATYVRRELLLEEALKRARPFDIFLTLGAGDIWIEGVELLKRLKSHLFKKLRVGLVYGGKSKEHEISIKSANHINKSFDSEIFSLNDFYISKEGNWSDSPTPITAEVIKALYQCDIVFPMLHGPYGEDGTIQGFFEMLNIPYVGCNHQSSAQCMDKAVTKKLAQAAKLEIAPYWDFNCYEWKKNPQVILNKIESILTFPLFVKPVHLGSTFGVKKVQNEKELMVAIESAFLCDFHVLVEKEIIGREIEFSVWGSQDITVFPPGEILTYGSIYDYEAKYNKEGFSTLTHASLPSHLIEEGKNFARKAYMCLGCDGYARVDCFLDKDNRFYLNEINPIPGFTENSLFPKMCESNGLALKDLLSELICLGLARHQLRKKCSP